jgi:sugar lactone lactonase YvrE
MLIEEKAGKLQIAGRQSYCVKVKSEEIDCRITSACYMEDGTIVLADVANNKLKRLDSHNYIITDCYSLPEEPHQICKINEAQVAVTLPCQREVHLISVDRQMKTTYKIKTDFKCYSLAYANNHLYISDKTSVYICSMSGRKLKQFIIDPDGGMYSLTNSLVAVSKDGTRIYHVKSHRLEVLDNNGQIVTTFSGKLLKGASYCHVTEAGSVLVSGQFSNNVLQFTSDGELIGEVIKADCDNLNLKPQSVCCNHQMSKMCIVREDNNIEVYDI